MNIPRPRFCVGEEVAVVGTFTSDFNIDRTEVVCAEYWEEGRSNRNPASGWRYKTAHQPDMSMSWFESSLRKLPPSERLEWKDCSWQPDAATVST